MKELLSSFYNLVRWNRVVPPRNFNEYVDPLSFNDDEISRYQQILLDPVFQKGMRIAEMKKPSAHTSDDAIKVVSKIQGWELHYAALMMVGIQPKPKKENKPLKNDWQEQSDIFKTEETKK